ncbi:MAG: hypothetical protein N3F03_04610 [Ignavibacteria bacterium]|nr:hypothetical protein [Ignavibacteria bacterium]
MRRRKRRIFLFVFIMITAALSYYFVEYSYKKELEDLSKTNQNNNQNQFENLNPSDVIPLIQTKIDTLRKKINNQVKVIPYYSDPVQVYEKVIQTFNLLNQNLELNIDKFGSENIDGFRIEKFQVKGEGKFTDLFHLINLFETSEDLYKIKISEIKQTFTTDDKGKTQEKVLFKFFLDAYYTTQPEFKFVNSLEKKNLRSVIYINDLFESLIKMDVPPNEEGLFEVDGAKLLAIMPDAVYLIDKKGNSFTLTEGDEVYLGYLTKIDYQNYTCEFLLNKGGILERVKLVLDDKEDKK